MWRKGNKAHVADNAGFLLKKLLVVKHKNACC